MYSHNYSCVSVHTYTQHAKRLYPLQISPKVPVEWGYAAVSNDDESTTWSSVDKSILSEAPEGIEKMIGFEGKPDPSTGFYCVSGCSRSTDDCLAQYELLLLRGVCCRCLDDCHYHRHLTLLLLFVVFVYAGASFLAGLQRGSTGKQRSRSATF